MSDVLTIDDLKGRKMTNTDFWGVDGDVSARGCVNQD